MGAVVVQPQAIPKLAIPEAAIHVRSTLVIDRDGILMIHWNLSSSSATRAISHQEYRLIPQHHLKSTAGGRSSVTVLFFLPLFVFHSFPAAYFLLLRHSLSVTLLPLLIVYSFMDLTDWNCALHPLCAN
jgi:hypothetical protein